MYSDFNQPSHLSSSSAVERLNATYRRPASASSGASASRHNSASHNSTHNNSTRSQAASADVLSTDGSWTEVIMLLVVMFGLLITSSVALGLAIGRVTVVAQHITELASHQRAHDLGLSTNESR